jgi:hypothetical protein
VATVLRAPRAANSGFILHLPPGTGPVSLYALPSSGVLAPLTRGAGVSEAVVAASRKTSVRWLGRNYRLSADRRAGFVDASSPPTSQPYQLDVAESTDLAAFRYLRIMSPQPLGRSTFVVSNETSSDPNRQVRFQTLPLVGHSVQASVGSCLQWHGYNSKRSLYLTVSGDAHKWPITVSLSR